MRVLYIDSLLLFEFLSDLTLLWAAGKLCGARRSWRLLPAALLGAGYALLAALWEPAGLLPGRIGALALMLLLAYGGEKRLWRLALAFLCMCAVYAGVATAVSLTAGETTLRALVFALGMSLGICALPFRYAGRRGGIVRLKLVTQAGEVSLQALLDTGNQLREPISGAPVIIAREEELLPLLEESRRAALLRSRHLPAELRLVELGGGFRLLPYRTVDGEGFLLAFRPEAVYVDGELRRGYWAAMSPRPIAARSGCTALMNGEEEG